MNSHHDQSTTLETIIEDQEDCRAVSTATNQTQMFKNEEFEPVQTMKKHNSEPVDQDKNKKRSSLKDGRSRSGYSKDRSTLFLELHEY